MQVWHGAACFRSPAGQHTLSPSPRAGGGSGHLCAARFGAASTCSSIMRRASPVQQPSTWAHKYVEWGQCTTHGLGTWHPPATVSSVSVTPCAAHLEMYACMQSFTDKPAAAGRSWLPSSGLECHISCWAVLSRTWEFRRLLCHLTASAGARFPPNAAVPLKLAAAMA